MEAGSEFDYGGGDDRAGPAGAVAVAFAARAGQWVTKDEVVEMITHLEFYAGWPNAVSAVAVAREVYR